MLFNSATVLSTLAVAGNVAASNLHHGHAQFHAKRDVEAKRQYESVDWDKALKDVNWSSVNFDGAASSTAVAEVNVASAPKTTSVAAAKPTTSAAAAKPTTTAAAKPSTTAAAKPSTTSAAAPAKSSTASSGGSASDLLNVASFVSKLGVKAGINSKTATGDLWLGSDSNYKATFTNEADGPVAVFCWGAKTMWINANQPQIFVQLKAGESTTVSIAEGFSGGCGAAASDSTLFMGLLNESILEFTANKREKGCFDISREVNMKGLVLTAKGSQCTSGVSGGKLSCVFVCKSGSSCESAGTYAIALGSATQGPCMVGTASDGGASGGCQMGDGEHMQVSISGSRSWPSS